MKDLKTRIAEKFKDKDFEKKYHRTATYYRLADDVLLLRRKRGLTQKELAEKAGTTQAVVSRLESASVKPSVETVLNFADALDAVLTFHLTPIEETRRKNEELKIVASRNMIAHSSFPINVLEKYIERQSNEYYFAKTQSKPDLATLLFSQTISITKKDIEYA